MPRQLLLPFAFLALLVALAALASTGCNKKPNTPGQPGPQAEAEPTGNNPNLALAQKISLFAGTALISNIPLDLDINQTGNNIFVQFLPREDSSFQIVELEVDSKSKLKSKFQLYASPAQGRAYVKGNPSQDECLILDNRQDAPGTPVLDTVWRAKGGQREEVIYLPLIPDAKALPTDACYALEPFYTNSGADVIVPLKAGGLCLVTATGAGSKYAAYPPTDIVVAGTACQTLPDQGARRVALLRWSLGNPATEATQIDMLNLDTMKWEASVRVPWPVYEISAEDVINGPWLLSGSRFPEVASENFRVPRLARADPATSAVDIVEFYGEPYWFVRLDPTGKYVVYMDQEREALVRLNIITGELDIDRTWYNKEAQLFVSPGADPVYAWKDTILYRAKWGEREQHPGLGGE